MKETPAYQSRFEPWRFWVLYGIIGLLFGFYAIKLFSVQIINGEEYRVRAEETIKRMAFHDALTGLPNRAYFEEEVYLLDQGNSFPVSVIMIDVDRLKEINDRHGHA
ncbi:MAG: diguanylate cyclase, partial [Anaerolineaceae bacterium]|nr:diguanylate cyclase [Anaerolineaceae bacterium]